MFSDDPTKSDDHAYFLDDNGVRGEGIWTGIAAGDYVNTGVHLDIDGHDTVVLDAENARKLAAMLIADAKRLELVLASA